MILTLLLLYSESIKKQDTKSTYCDRLFLVRSNIFVNHELNLSPILGAKDCIVDPTKRIKKCDFSLLVTVVLSSSSYRKSPLLPIIP